MCNVLNKIDVCLYEVDKRCNNNLSIDLYRVLHD